MSLIEQEVQSTLRKALATMESRRTILVREINAVRGALTVFEPTGGRKMTAAQRQAVSRRMRAYWRDKRRKRAS